MTISSLRVIGQPTVEPVSLAAAKAHLRVDYDDEDDLIRDYIQVARDRAEQFLRRALITRTLRYTLAPSPPPMAQAGAFFNPSLIVLPLAWPQAMQAPIELPMAPAQQISAVRQRRRDGSVVTLDPATAYYGDVLNEPGAVTLRGVFQTVGMDLSIEYTAGYGDDPAAIPPSMVHAIKLILGWLYEHRGDDDGGLPAAATALLSPDRMNRFA